ncbi:cytochrome P450 2U1-like [Mytilus trossulus]|uniref:cytochrome P450 2U1-like n=1 Tax=Mytilus trossulus TaxID=6551 RepID=UPI003003EA1E
MPQPTQKFLEETQHFLRVLSDLNGDLIYVSDPIYAAVSNIICSIALGERFEYNDVEFKKLINVMYELLANQNIPAINLIPVLQYLPGDIFGAKHEDFPIAVFELFGAGTDTISNTLTWSVLCLLKNPDVQDRMRDEMFCTIPTDRPPTMADKLNLPFCEAVIAETQRLANILPFALQRAATEDVMIGKFKILKGSFVIPNLSSEAHDEELFPDYLKFDPLRFIDKQGKFYGQERNVPFSLGKRSCPGESLARMELFLFITSIVKKFRILPDTDGIFPSSKGQLGIAYVPNPFKVRFVERN